jgi:hypothetical protein
MFPHKNRPVYQPEQSRLSYVPPSNPHDTFQIPQHAQHFQNRPLPIYRPQPYSKPQPIWRGPIAHQPQVYHCHPQPDISPYSQQVSQQQLYPGQPSPSSQFNPHPQHLYPDGNHGNTRPTHIPQNMNQSRNRHSLPTSSHNSVLGIPH